MTYKKNFSGDEYYATNSYAKLPGGAGEYYAQKHNGDQFYMRHNNKDIFAKKKNSDGKYVDFFAFDATGYPVYPKIQEHGTEELLDIPYYINDQNTELYPRNNEGEAYILTDTVARLAKLNTGSEYYITLSTGAKVYPVKQVNDQWVEYLAKDENGKDIYIEENNTIRYPINTEERTPIYPVNKETGDQFYISINNRECYAVDFIKKGPVYCIDKNGDQLFAKRNGMPYYCSMEFNNKRYEVYPRKKNGKQFYLRGSDGKKYILRLVTMRHMPKQKLMTTF